MTAQVARLRFARALARVVDHGAFQSTILFLLVINALCLIAETAPGLADEHGDLLVWVFAVSQVVFVVEIGLRLLAHWPDVRRFFDNGWNTFDFVVVAISLVPAIGVLSFAARLLRVVRVLRIVSMVGRLAGRR